MKNLIVTADDYGVFPSINEGIITAVNAKKVDSVSVLSNYKGAVLPDAPSGTRFENSLTNVKWLINSTKENSPEIGCHLTVTSGKPLTGNKMEFACGSSGNFNDFSDFKNFTEPEQLKNLYNELCAQVEELQSVCTIKHLTNHHNSLTLFPHHFEQYMKVAQKFNLPMRSADVRPKERQERYLWVQDRLLTGDIPKAEREQILAFQEKIVEEFRNNPFGVRGPGYLESRHYGPIGLVPFARIINFLLPGKKREKLNEFYSEFEKSADKSVELLMHIAKPGILLVDASESLDYSGVDRSYFDSRVVEFNSIMGVDFSEWSAVERRGWGEL